MNVFIEVLNEGFSGVGETRFDLLAEFALELVEGGFDFLSAAACLVDGEDAFFKIDTAFDAAENFIRGTEDFIEEFVFFSQELVDALVGVVAGVEEVNDDNVVFLAVAVATANALLDALGIPRKVEVDDEGAKLHVDALGGGFGGNEDGAVVAKVLDEGGADVDGFGGAGAVGVGIFGEPLLINGFGLRIVVSAVEGDYFSSVAVFFKVEGKGVLGAAGLGENEGALVGRLAVTGVFLHFLEAGAQSGKEFGGFRFEGDAETLADEFSQVVYFCAEGADADVG